MKFTHGRFINPPQFACRKSVLHQVSYNQYQPIDVNMLALICDMCYTQNLTEVFWCFCFLFEYGQAVLSFFIFTLCHQWLKHEIGFLIHLRYSWFAGPSTGGICDCGREEMLSGGTAQPLCALTSWYTAGKPIWAAWLSKNFWLTHVNSLWY